MMIIIEGERACIFRYFEGWIKRIFIDEFL